MNFYAYRLMIRDSADSLLLKSGRLLHPYAVNMYVKIETERLQFIRFDQEKLVLRITTRYEMRSLLTQALILRTSDEE